MFDGTNVIIQGNKAEEILRQKLGEMNISHVFSVFMTKTSQ